MPLDLTPIGTVHSTLTDRSTAPRQADEGAPPATLVFATAVAPGLDGLRAGDEILLLTWLDRASRDVLTVHPRGDVTRPKTGVFNTRSPNRPNPIGLHRVRVTSIDGLRIAVDSLEALDGTPIVDVKPVLAENVADR